jgi:hypothetical protein
MLGIDIQSLILQGQTLRTEFGLFLGYHRQLGHTFPNSFAVCQKLNSFICRQFRLFAEKHPRRGEAPGGLDGYDELAVGGHVAVGHARRVEREAGIALAVEENEPPGSAGTLAKEVNGLARGEIGAGEPAGIGF